MVGIQTWDQTYQTNSCWYVELTSADDVRKIKQNKISTGDRTNWPTWLKIITTILSTFGIDNHLKVALEDSEMSFSNWKDLFTSLKNDGVLLYFSINAHSNQTRDCSVFIFQVPLISSRMIQQISHGQAIAVPSGKGVTGVKKQPIYIAHCLMPRQLHLYKNNRWGVRSDCMVRSRSVPICLLLSNMLLQSALHLLRIYDLN